jgi:cardiolipin synthase A/B
MKLMIQPEGGVTALLNGIDNTRRSIEIAIFRFDHVELRHALERAAARGVSVHTLIADTNRGNERDLQKLETDLLCAGIQVSRTAHDLLRHHYKFMVVDDKVLYLLTFHFTYLDIDNSRSFGIITENGQPVREALRLFHADIKRQGYTGELRNLIVSPINARQELSRFIKGAEKQLLIYDPEISDRAMIALLRDRARNGVAIHIIGRVTRDSPEFEAGRLMRLRFHTRAIIRDRAPGVLAQPEFAGGRTR